MEASLEDDKHNNSYELGDKELKVTVPLTRCLQGLKEKHNVIAKLHRERFEQVKSKVLVVLVVTRLTLCRARSGPGVVLIASGTLVRPSQASPNGRQCEIVTFVRPFPILCHISRQRILKGVRGIYPTNRYGLLLTAQGLPDFEIADSELIEQRI